MMNIVVSVLGCVVSFVLGYSLCKIKSNEIINDLLIYAEAKDEVLKAMEQVKDKQRELIEAYKEQLLIGPEELL